MTRTNRRPIWIILAMLLVAASCSSSDSESGGSDPGPDDAAAGGALTGTITIDAGSCDGPDVTGSSFRMVQSGGTLADGPYVPNGDSPCDDQTWTPLSPGTDGGIVLGQHQPSPDPAFDDGGGGTAAAITSPATWFAVGFAAATNPVDPQTELEVAPPTLTAAADGTLTGDMRSFAASWNGQHFNQGAPKPDGSMEGNTSVPTGTYDASTGKIVVEWTSQISGGAFDGFTGVWHFEGTISNS